MEEQKINQNNSTTSDLTATKMIPGETAYFAASPLLAKDISKKEPLRKNNNVWPILSIIATIVPIIVWSYCFITSKGSFDESSTGAVWWLMIIYYWTIGLPLLIASVAFGIKGLKSKLWLLSLISILLKVITVVAIFIVLIITA